MNPHPPPLPPETQRLLRSARKYLLNVLPLLQVPELRDMVANILVTGNWEDSTNVYALIHSFRPPLPIDSCVEHLCFWSKRLSRDYPTRSDDARCLKGEIRDIKRQLKSHEQNSQPTLHPAEGV